jgi:uncharacterized membrane protein YhiD involved in acid resistance
MSKPEKDRRAVTGSLPAPARDRTALHRLALVAAVILVLSLAGVSTAQHTGLPVSDGEPDLRSQLEPFLHGLYRIPLAALLGAALAFRPRRRGTPMRMPAVLQTQIILALVGALVMLVVGSSVARAFGIVGAASLVRYRAKIDDPKDAGVMLSTLGLGLASGVGLYLLAVFGAIVILAVLWLLESLEPEGLRLFRLKIKAKDAPDMRTQVEQILRRNQVNYDLRSSSGDEVVYEVTVPFDKKTERLSNAILELMPNGDTEVEWEDRKAAKVH